MAQQHLLYGTTTNDGTGEPLRAGMVKIEANTSELYTRLSAVEGLGALSYQGLWNASTNTPTLANGTGTKGYYYKVSVAGTTALNGPTDWFAGDVVVYNGTTWDRIDGGQTEVVAVAGRTGVVTLTVADVAGAASLASPALTGVPLSTTAAAGTNTTQIATTAFVNLPQTVTSRTAAGTLVIGEANAIVEVDVASAATITVPPNTTVAFPVGTVIELVQIGAGTVTAGAGAGVTISGASGATATAGQWKSVFLRKRATDNWLAQ